MLKDMQLIRAFFNKKQWVIEGPPGKQSFSAA